jgi:hypothetical protein
MDMFRTTLSRHAAPNMTDSAHSYVHAPLPQRRYCAPRTAARACCRAPGRPNWCPQAALCGSRLGPGTLDHADHLSGHTLLIAEGACSSRRGEVGLDFWKLQRHAESMLRHCPHPKAISEFSRTIAARSPRSLSAHLGLRSKRAARHWSQG